MSRFVMDWKQLLLIVAIGVGGAFSTAQAQSREPHRARGVEQERSRAQEGSSVGSLPSWAEPEQGPGRESVGRARGRASDQGGVTTQDDHTPPGVPVDGGLVWLILAGGGYASWKLGSEKDGRFF